MHYYQKSINEFMKEETLFHFTNYDALVSIINYKRFRLSNFSSINDPNEEKYINPFWSNKVFFISFSNKKTDNLWEKYAGGVKKGVCLSIKNDGFDKLTIYDDSGNQYKKIDEIDNYQTINYKSYEYNTDWVIYDVSCLKVIYDDNIELNREYDNELINIYKNCVNINEEQLKKDFCNINGQGFIKTRKWEDENEYRIRVTVRPIGLEQIYFGSIKKTPQPPFEYVYIDISHMLSNIKIYIKCGFNKLDEISKLCNVNNMEFEILK